ncbi:hypothetical protein JCM11251_003944 [Rhodosporidiobolus azoricus]
MLPSHPAVLPPLYDSTASTTEDDDADSERDEGEEGMAASVASSLRGERRRRDEARASRRRGSTMRFEAMPSSLNEKGTRPPMKQVANWDEKRTVYPTSAGRDGLGFVIEGLGGADYDALTDQAAAPNFQRTYTSDLGSGISNESSPATSPALPRPSSRLAVTHESAISFADVHSPRSRPSSSFRETPPSESRVRFEQPRRLYRQRTNSSNTDEGLHPEHIVFPDTVPLSDPLSTPASRRTSSIFSAQAAAYSSPATSAAPSSRHASPSMTATRARSPRLPAGPATLAGESVARASKLYFPIPPSNPRSPLATYSSPVASAASSTTSLPFPSRPAQNALSRHAQSPASQHSSTLYFPSPSSATSTSPVFPSRSRVPSESARPFPNRSQHRPTRSLTSDPSALFASHTAIRSPGPFPPPPTHSPHARYLHTSDQTSTTSDLPISPSFASTYSNLTVAEPVFPSLGAKLAEDGIVRSDVSNRRITKAPWEIPPGARESDEDGDELDQMMRAQRRGAAARDQAAAKEREERRKSIHAELLKQSGLPPNLAKLPPIPSSPLQVQDDAFQRALLEADTVKRSLGQSLLSDSASTPRPSPGDEEPPVSYAASEASISLETGMNMTPSSSTSSEMSLPSFPDVPSHHNLYFPSPPRRSPHAGQSVALNGGEEGLETLEEEAIVANGARANGFVSSVDFAEDGNGKQEVGRRVSVVSESEASRYEDAEEASSSPRGLQEVLAAPIAVMPQRRELDNVVEEVEDESQDSRRLPRLRLPTTSPAPSSPATPLISAFPPIPTTPPARSSPSFSRSREASAGSSLAAPPSPSPLQRIASLSPSAASRSSATSSAAVSFTLPRRANPTSNGFVKPKISLGKKLGSLFATTSSNRGGISSRDVLSSSAVDENPFSWSTSAAPTQSEWEASQSASMSAYSALGLRTGSVPASGSSSAAETDDTLYGGGKENRPARSAALDDLLSRFEVEEKERIRGIAQKAKGAAAVQRLQPV